MRKNSIKTIALALTIAATLSATPTFAATRERGQERDRSAIERVVRMVQRFFGVAPNDTIFIPHP
ncbi:MAG TPA: hypothetical protein VGR02_10840 [Thermoanaerobaculia bacterium]|jgi:hypothetical protein|nr:hypothetical protein [Thermoanaerobaculia bacterium]